MASPENPTWEIHDHYQGCQGTHYGIIVQYELKPMPSWFADPESRKTLRWASFFYAV